MKPPAELARLQAAFGESIATPFRFLDDQNNFAMRTDDYAEEAVAAVAPRGAKGSADRIAVYNQQYWFRLLSIMQEEFPLTDALMGSEQFTRFAMAYLDAHPPDSPRLRDLSQHLSTFATAVGRTEVEREAIALERIYIDVFDAAAFPTIDAEDPESAARLATEPLRFQPHFYLFDAKTNVVKLRRLVKNDTEVTLADVAAQHATWAIWRGNGIQAIELGPIQAQLLRRILDGAPLGDACEDLAERLSAEHLDFLVQHVQRWFAVWGAAGWFAA